MVLSGREQHQGSKMAPGPVRTGPEAAVGVGRGTTEKKECQANAVSLFPSTNPPHHPVRLVPPPNLLPGRSDRVKEPH